MSQYIEPSKTPKVYKTIHISSEINNIDTKFLGFNDIRIINNQNIRDQKDSHVNI